MIRQAAQRGLALALAVLVCSAHVGSPDVWYEGNAGPYPILVVVRLPGVVPGVAEVTLRADNAALDRVTLFVNRFDATAAAPPPEDAKRVVGDSSSFVGKLWIMAPGSNSVTVGVYGSKGTGKVVVPVVAVSVRRLPLYRWLGVVLGAIALFLFVGAISIAGSAVREGTLEPGDMPDPARRRRARYAMVGTALLVGVMLFGGWSWWSATDTAFRDDMYRPFAVQPSVPSPGQFALTITDSLWTHRHDSTWFGQQRRRGIPWSVMIPDHGKLMHLFLVADSGPAFAHLHPTTADTDVFRAALPPLPPGRYRVFADVVHESGFGQTLTASVELPSGGAALGDSDDAWSTAVPVHGAHAVTLADGSTLQWLGSDSVRVGQPAGLRFGSSAIEPYMGMAGHAVVVRDDGTVFIHLHPMGTVSAASQMALVMRQPSDTTNGALARRLATMSPMQMATVGDTVSFPYAFPRAGHYLVWVQIKRHGRILTAPFAIDAY